VILKPSKALVSPSGKEIGGEGIGESERHEAGRSIIGPMRQAVP
jgi:hypothetical protein